ncbi:hypothetical protein T265_13840, partial [Opisthorchis viverrini]
RIQETIHVFEKYTQLQNNLVFTRGSTESLVYDILQLNVLYTGRLMIHEDDDTPEAQRHTGEPKDSSHGELRHNRLSLRVSLNLIFYLNPNYTKLAKYKVICKQIRFCEKLT